MLSGRINDENPVYFRVNQDLNYSKWRRGSGSASKVITFNAVFDRGKCRSLPSKRSLSSLRWFLLSRRISLSICSLIRRCSFASSLRQHAIFSHWRSLESPDKILSSSTKNAQNPAFGVAMGGDLRGVKFTHSWGLYFPNSTTQFNGVQSDI